MSSVERTIRIVTHQKILDEVPPVEGYPVREWSIEIFLLDKNGDEVPATIFDKVTYHLHPTFANPNRVFKKAPFKILEQGWGGFEMGLSLLYVDKAGEVKLAHDLNFLSEKYDIDHKIKVPIAKSATLRTLVAESGDVPEEIGDKRKQAANGSSTAGSISGDKKRSKLNNNAINTTNSVKGSVDLEKLAEGLVKLNEDDLLGVVQMVTDNRTPDMNIKNDVDEGEFTMDLYTLPDSLLKSLWDYVKKRTE